MKKFYKEKDGLRLFLISQVQKSVDIQNKKSAVTSVTMTPKKEIKRYKRFHMLKNTNISINLTNSYNQ